MFMNLRISQIYVKGLPKSSNAEKSSCISADKSALLIHLAVNFG